MNNASFEDTVFIITMRIRMIRDILRLNPPPELFLEKCLDDLVFIDWVLAYLGGRCSGMNEFDYVSDTEWQFSQLLTEFSLEANPFSSKAFPQTGEKITLLRSNCDARRKALEESDIPLEMARTESVVSSAELLGLLGET
jgi:hypothetical protein